MSNAVLKLALIFAMGAILSACARDGNNGRPLLNLRQSAIAPDEFLVVPQKPLETPSDLSSLPEPIPGAQARVSIDFEENLLKMLGGQSRGGGVVPQADAALINAARGAFGVTPGIRDIVRAEDQAFRDDRAGRIERLAKKRKAATIYDPMLLDPFAEATRMQSLGVKIPAIPPL